MTGVLRIRALICGPMLWLTVGGIAGRPRNPFFAFCGYRDFMSFRSQIHASMAVIGSALIDGQES